MGADRVLPRPLHARAVGQPVHPLPHPVLVRLRDVARHAAAVHAHVTLPERVVGVPVEPAAGHAELRAHHHRLRQRRSAHPGLCHQLPRHVRRSVRMLDRRMQVPSTQGRRHGGSVQPLCAWRGRGHLPRQPRRPVRREVARHAGHRRLVDRAHVARGVRGHGHGIQPELGVPRQPRPTRPSARGPEGRVRLAGRARGDLPGRGRRPAKPVRPHRARDGRGRPAARRPQQAVHPRRARGVHQHGEHARAQHLREGQAYPAIDPTASAARAAARA